MKKRLLLLVVLLFGYNMFAAELTPSSNRVIWGKNAFNILPKGPLTMTIPLLYNYQNFGLTTKSKIKWYTLGIAPTTLKEISSETGNWVYDCTFPLTDETNINVKRTVSLNQFNGINIKYTWDKTKSANIIEAYHILQSSMSVANGSIITINEQDFKIDSTKSGNLIHKTIEDAKIVFFKGNPNYEFCVDVVGKTTINLYTNKASVMMRILASPASGELDLTVIPK